MTLSNRTKFGITIAFSVLASLSSFLLAVLLLALAAFLIAWGQEPKRTEEFVEGLPYGAHLRKGLNELDSILS